MSEKSIHSFVGRWVELSELSGLSFGWFWVEVCQIFHESQHRQNCCFCGQMCVLTCRLELKWSQDKSIRKDFTCFVCVLMWSDWVGWRTTLSHKSLSHVDGWIGNSKCTQNSQKACTKLLSLPIFSPSAKIKISTLSKAYLKVSIKALDCKNYSRRYPP